MAVDTPLNLRNQVIYSIFVRNYSAEGTFDAVRRDLTRIRALGVDIIWLMPIHPIGEAARKGSLGSPYANRDYRSINTEFGTMADFRALVGEIHRQGMKCIIDVVYNHTSPDSLLSQEHPEWFYHRPDGGFGNRFGDWSDVIDLDYSNRGLWDYQIETLMMWAEVADGFRCDVAPLVPIDFWEEARSRVARVRPGCLWLAESVHPSFIRFARSEGLQAASDGELYRAFDMTYDYDIYDSYLNALTGRGTPADFIRALDEQESRYPGNYVKMHALENHDRPRAAGLIPDVRARRNWTAFCYFAKGAVMLYNGQESSCVDRPSLFDRDPVDWNCGEDLSPLMRRLYAIKKAPIFAHGSFSVRPAGSCAAVAEYRWQGTRLAGLFCLDGKPAAVPCELPDGHYINLIDRETVRVDQGLAVLKGEPAILEIEA